METNGSIKTVHLKSTTYIDTLEEGANISVDLGPIELPEWYDDVKYKRGQELFKRNFYAMFVGKLCGLLAIIAVPSILRVLIHTNQSSEPRTAYRRYVATIMHTLEWYYEALVPSSRSWKSITFVRKTHAGVSKQANSAHPGMIISQKDMAITQFGFIGYIVTSHRKLGIHYGPGDWDAFVHFWRVIGYMMGIEDRFNACTDSFETTAQRMSLIASEILQPALLNRTTEFEKMGRALIEGLWCFNPFVYYESFLFLTMRLNNIPGYHYWDEEAPAKVHSKNHYEHFTRYGRFVLFCISYILSVLMNFTIFRWYFNRQMIISRFLITHFPFLAIHQYGVEDAYVRILK